MIACNTYYCQQCGKGLESKDIKQGGESCPYCQSDQIALSAWSLFFAAGFIVLVSSLLSLVWLVIPAGLCAGIGILRLLRQVMVLRKRA